MASRTPPSDALAAWLATQRWFAAKTHAIVGVTVEETVPLWPGALHLLQVALDDGTVERYAVDLLPGPAVRDALDEPAFARALVRLIAEGGRARGAHGEVAGYRSLGFPRGFRDGGPVVRVGAEQSNTSFTIGDLLIVKRIRRVMHGLNPDVEIPRFLTEHTAFRHTPRLAGYLEYREAAGVATLAAAQELVRGAQDGWTWLLERLRAGDAALADLARLGERTAGLHLALATPTADPAFATEPIGAADVAAWAAAVREQVAAARAALRGRALPEVAGLERGLEGLLGRARLRHHGDYHLGQTLRVEPGADFVIVDFEGEPLRPLEERRGKHTPLRDAAGMLRSLAYAAATVSPPGGTVAWERAAREAFLRAYLDGVAGAPFLPGSAAAVTGALAVLEAEKAAYEIVYEANHRPDWVGIPLAGYLRAAASSPPAARSGAA